GRRHDVRRGREVGLADLQVDDLGARGFQGPGPGQHLERGLSTQPTHPVGEGDGRHGLMIRLSPFGRKTPMFLLGGPGGGSPRVGRVSHVTRLLPNGRSTRQPRSPGSYGGESVAAHIIGRSGSDTDAARLLDAAEPDFARYEVIKDLVDECIDLSLNYRQSGHPGGSRSKVHMMLALLLSGAMRWDVLRPWRRFGDRFVLSAGHTVPLVYATLAVLNEAMRARHERTGAAEFAFPDDGRWALTWEQLLKLRRRGGLPGHAEMEGRTLFLKFNTGPSGHGMPPAAGEALSLKLAGADQVKVFVFEGEGGLTPGSAHETKNLAWGLGLDNLVFMVDWNDFGIDPRPASSVVAGTPVDWFAPYGWRVNGTEHGMEWGPVTQNVLEVACGP